MLRSMAVAYVKHSSSCRTLLIFDIFSYNLFIKFPHIDNNPYGRVLLWYYKCRQAHSDLACHCNTLKSCNLWIW